VTAPPRARDLRRSGTGAGNGALFTAVGAIAAVDGLEHAIARRGTFAPGCGSHRFLLAGPSSVASRFQIGGANDGRKIVRLEFDNDGRLFATANDSEAKREHHRRRAPGTLHGGAS
jgi:hypothetical protein